jgi:hypothetical protein
MFIFKPEFVMNFFSPGRLRQVKRRSKAKRPVLIPGVGNSSDDEDDSDEAGSDGNHAFIPIDSSSLFRGGDDDEKVLVGCSRKPGRLQYHRLCVMTSSPNNWGSLLLELSKESARTAGILVWGEVIEKMADLDRNNRQEGKRARIRKIKTVLAWMRIAEIESSWGEYFFLCVIDESDGRCVFLNLSFLFDKSFRLVFIFEATAYGPQIT